MLRFILQFGHALQHLLTTVEYSDIAGLSCVEWDAVFICDFFMENWYEIKSYEHADLINRIDESVTN